LRGSAALKLKRSLYDLLAWFVLIENGLTDCDLKEAKNLLDELTPLRANPPERSKVLILMRSRRLLLQPQI
jgi:hypothetical protein